MFISYAKYIGLMTALDEHYKGTLSKYELQDMIFEHYGSTYGSFVIENAAKSKRLFVYIIQKNRRNKSEREVFRNFMNNIKSKEHGKNIKM